MQAEDEEGQTDTTSFYFEVSGYDYPTGYFKDKRDNKYYSTVKIGDYWWMSENLDRRMEKKQNLPHVQMCYDNDEENCDKYGALYAIEFLSKYQEYYEDSICPEGWHIPGRIEMGNLIDNIDYPDGMSALRPGGSSGFNALLSGYIIYQCNTGENCHPCCYSYSHYHKGFSTYFMTNSYRLRSLPARIYTLNIQTNDSELYPVETNAFGYYSLRCVRD